jgi:hypothetical protein
MPTFNNSQQQDFTELIRQELPKHYRKFGRYTLKNTTIHPAKKYAFYNPAKTDAAGNAVIRKSFGTTFMLLLSISLFSIPLIISGVQLNKWHLLLIPLAGYGIVLGSFLYNKNKYIIINREGILLFDRMFPWGGLQGVYIVVIASGKHADTELVLADTTLGLVFTDISNFGKMNEICTAVRDFQPVE